MPGWPDIIPQKEDPDAELKAKYRIVFGTDLGRDVLANILTRLKFGCYLSEALGDIALHNVAVEILGMLKMIGPGRERDLVNALCSIPIPKEEVK